GSLGAASPPAGIRPGARRAAPCARRPARPLPSTYAGASRSNIGSMGTMVFQPYDTLRPMTEDHRVTSIFFTELSADQMRRHLPDVLGVYIRAMGYPAAVRSHRAPLWAEHVLRQGWRAIAAFSHDGDDDGGEQTAPPTLVGIAYGYHGGPAYWWDRQVRDGLQRTGGDTAVLDDYFELTELHVEPGSQGHGIGHGLLTRLLAGRPEARVLLRS